MSQKEPGREGPDLAQQGRPVWASHFPSLNLRICVNKKGVSHPHHIGLLCMAKCTWQEPLKSQCWTRVSQPRAQRDGVGARATCVGT